MQITCSRHYGDPTGQYSLKIKDRLTSHFGDTYPPDGRCRKDLGRRNGGNKPRTDPAQEMRWCLPHPNFNFRQVSLELRHDTRCVCSEGGHWLSVEFVYNKCLVGSSTRDSTWRVNTLKPPCEP